MFELTNKNGVPVETVGELIELLKPFREEAEITPLKLYYVPMDGNKSAKLKIEIANNRPAQDGGDECLCNTDQTYRVCPVHHKKLTFRRL